MPFTFLNSLLIGRGFLGTTLLFSSKGQPKIAGPSPRLVGKSWLSGLISPQTVAVSSFLSGTNAFKRVVAPAQAILGKGSIEFPLLSGWSQKDINTNDPIEVA